MCVASRVLGSCLAKSFADIFLLIYLREKTRQIPVHPVWEGRVIQKDDRLAFYPLMHESAGRSSRSVRLICTFPPSSDNRHCWRPESDERSSATIKWRDGGRGGVGRAGANGWQHNKSQVGTNRKIRNSSGTFKQTEKGNGVGTKASQRGKCMHSIFCLFI